ncbi:MAG: Rid family detoxifying hydrolase [Candidatus Woesearchaeota archaeon]|nr:Rid family detoxifying hydrolase [Candidatus Woesearchaeota archaeon]
MTKEIIPSSGAFPLSKAVVHNDTYIMEISGQIGVNPQTGQLEEGIKAQTSRVLEIIKEILHLKGWSLKNVVKTRIFLLDMKDYAFMNEVYSTYFSADYPARFALAVKELPRNALIEIDCTATGDTIKE